MKRLASIVLLLMTARALPAQAPAPSSIIGSLMHWGTAEPISPATIELRDLQGEPVAITGVRSTGEFAFTNVPRGTYRIVAMAEGFATGEYGQLRPNGDGRPLTVAASEDVRVKIGMAVGGVISGRVTDQDGQPMVYASVEIRKLAYDAEGQPTPSLALKAMTNDLGEYRAFWLPPGQYVVSSGRSRLNLFGNQGMEDPKRSDNAYPTTMITNTNRPRAAAPLVDDSNPESRLALVNSAYYPNAADARGAEVIDLRAGAEVSNINIRVASSGPASNAVWLRGVAVDASGQPVKGSLSVSIATWPLATPTPRASLRMATARVPATDPGQAARGAQVYVADNGKFDGAAAPGTYEIRARQGDLSGRVLVDVGNKDLDLKIPMFPLTHISGQVRVEGGTLNLAGLRVILHTSPNTEFSTSVLANGQFVVDKVVPGDYQISLPVSSLPNAYVKSVRAGNRDVIENSLRVEGGEPVPSLEIVVGLGAASIKGRAVNARGEAVAQATVVALPPGAPPYRADRYAVSTTGTSGQFEFRGLAPGGYRVFAWEDVDPGTWFNATYMATHEREAVSLAVGERETRDVSVSVIPAGQ